MSNEILELASELKKWEFKQPFLPFCYFFPHHLKSHFIPNIRKKLPDISDMGSYPLQFSQQKRKSYNTV